MANDTIIAHYEEIDTLWIITKPAGVATLEVESDIITSSPFMGLYKKGSIINIKAIPNGNNIFNQWNLNNNALPDYNATTLFTFIQDDTLFAYFNNVLALENIGDDIYCINIYPSIIDNKITVEIKSKENILINIDLLNVKGQKVQSLFNGKIKHKTFKQIFDLDVAKGIYFVNINTKKTNFSFKIIKN